jgi:hypothetical protein
MLRLGAELPILRVGAELPILRVGAELPILRLGVELLGRETLLLLLPKERLGAE